MCSHHYRKCPGCGEDIHRNFVCEKCGDPWEVRKRDTLELKKLRKKYGILMNAFKEAQEA